MADLATFVHVQDEDGNSVAFGPGDEVPAWAASKVTNPKAWVDGELPEIEVEEEAAEESEEDTEVSEDSEESTEVSEDAEEEGASDSAESDDQAEKPAPKRRASRAVSAK